MKNNFVAVVLVLIGSLSAVAHESVNLNWGDCVVVDVSSVNDHLFEEGLGSIYDMSEEGYSNSDGDSVNAFVLIKDNKIRFRLGQSGWDSQKDKISLKTALSDTTESGKETLVTLEIKDDADVLKAKIFTQRKVGQVYYKGKSDKDFEYLATFDCSGIKDLRER